MLSMIIGFTLYTFIDKQTSTIEIDINDEIINSTPSSNIEPIIEKNLDNEVETDSKFDTLKNDNDKDETNLETIDAINQEPEHINETVAVFGLDKGEMRTDVIFIVEFDSTTNTIELLSIPRDTKVTWDEEMKNKLEIIKSSGGIKNRGWVCKINELPVYSYSKSRSIGENIEDFTIYYLEKLTNKSIDDYIIVNIDAFKATIDAIGGVDIDVPKRMYYTDKSQGLYIDLQPGMQHLDGDKAEQLVRYRKGYPEGDVGRIKTQQILIDAVIDKITNPSIIFKIPELLSIMNKYIETSIDISDYPKYLPYLFNFDNNNLKMETLPGEGRYENGISYFFPE